MTDETTYLGSDQIPPERYLGPRRYKITCRCEVCLEEFSWETEKLTKRNKPCPNPVCVAARREASKAKEERNFAKMVEERTAPGRIGNNVMVNAVDTTADIVMQDYGMTNLQDNIREGDMVAPKLPAPQQRLADGYFGGKSMQANGMEISGRQAQLIRARALSGRYRHMAMNPKVAAYGHPEGEPALRSIGAEPLKSA